MRGFYARLKNKFVEGCGGKERELALLKQEHVCSHQMNAKIHHMIHQKTKRKSQLTR